MQGVNAHVERILILVDKPDSLLLLPVIDQLFQAIKHPYPMVDMGYIISGIQAVKLFQGHHLFPGISITQPEPVIAFKDLVIGKKSCLQVVVNEAFVDGVAE